MNREDKRLLVCQLYKEGKTMREISKEVHMSFSDIGSVIKKINGVDSQKDNFDIQAIKMFLKGKKPVEVSIELDLASEDVLFYYTQYLELQSMDELNRMYQQLGATLQYFIDFFKLTRRLNLDIHQVLEMLRYGEQLPFLKNKVLKLRKEIESMEYNKNILLNELISIQNQIKLSALNWS